MARRNDFIDVEVVSRRANQAPKGASRIVVPSPAQVVPAPAEFDLQGMVTEFGIAALHELLRRGGLHAVSDAIADIEDEARRG